MATKSWQPSLRRRTAWSYHVRSRSIPTYPRRTLAAATQVFPTRMKGSRTVSRSCVDFPIRYCEERHRLFRGMLRLGDTVEAHHVTLPPAVEVAAPLVREQDHLVLVAVVVVPARALPGVLHPCQGVPQVEVPLHDVGDLGVRLPGGEDVHVAVRLELGGGAGECLVEDGRSSAVRAVSNRSMLSSGSVCITSRQSPWWRPGTTATSGRSLS